MDTLKLVITGPFNAGKTALIRAVNEIRGVYTDVNTEVDRRVKRQTTVAMDFGRVTLSDGRRLHLYGTPGQQRFAFMWETLIVECDGILILVDSSDPASFPDAARMIDFFAARANGAPIFVAANKQDLPGAVSPEALSRALDLVGPRFAQAGRVVGLWPIPGCVAADRASVLSVLQAIVSCTATPLPPPLKGVLGTGRPLPLKGTLGAGAGIVGEHGGRPDSPSRSEYEPIATELA